MRLTGKRRKIRVKGLTVKILLLGMIIFGVVVFTVNVMKYTKGYYAYRLDRHNDQVEQVKQENDTGNLPTLDSSADSEEFDWKYYKLQKQREETKSLYSERPKIGDEIGELYIPKINLTLPIYQGTEDDQLDKGVGHYVGSVLPGEKDNCVLSGHRDTVFRKLGEVGEGDSLIVRTAVGEFEYKINKVRIVDKDDLTVIVPKPSATLTVSTCYPFHYIGAAPQRYVLVANLVY